MDLGGNNLTVRSLKTKFQLHYKPASQELPISVTFTPEDFTRPPQGMINNAVASLLNVISPIEVVAAKFNFSVPVAYMVTDIIKNGALLCIVNTTHLL